MKTLISTIHEGGAVLAAINKLSPDKLILIVIDPLDSIRKKAIDNIKKNFGKVIEIETIKTELYDIPKIVRDVNKAIEKESKAGNEISIHISESRKTQSIAAMFSGFINKDKIKGVYYIEEETGKVLAMPLLDFKLGPTKTRILKEISKGDKKMSSIIAKVGKNKSIVYSHIKDLKNDGYVTDSMELTDAGRICIL